MLSKRSILVTGSNGQLGSELKELAGQFPETDFHFISRTELSLSNPENIARVLSSYHPTYIINCAAYTAVDKAESENEEAFLVNATSVGKLAKYCFGNQVKFIHISTDYVFDGTSKEPLAEDATVNPINVYGESKLAGEREALQNDPDSIIIRTSWVYSSYGKNFVKTMMRLMKEKESLTVVSDQIGSPTYAADLAEAICHIIFSKKWVAGIYHYSNEGVISWADFAREIALLNNSSCTIVDTTTANYPTPAKRPLYSVMDKTKINSIYGIQLKPWKNSLVNCIRKLTAEEHH